jgi:hypothetical protein
MTGCPKCAAETYVGYEVRGVYDGVLYWLCPICGHAWPRFTGTDRLAGLSEKYADDHNRMEGS